MSVTSIHFLGAILITAGVSLFVLGIKYTYRMRLDVLSLLPKSRWNRLLTWISVTPIHAFHYPDSQMRKKYFFSTTGATICVVTGIRLWLVR